MSGSADPAARVRGVEKRYADVRALDGLDLDLERGQILALVGPNGAGKSTLLRVLGAVVTPDAGTVAICGVDALADSSAARRLVGLMIGDERSFYWRLTGAHNLEFFGVLSGLSKSHARRRSAELLAEVGLSDAADRAVAGYSSGMRARLALGRAMLADPPLLLLDEPTKTLDPLASTGFRELARHQARDRGIGIVLATHDLYEAVAVADRVAVLREGTIALEGTTGSLDAETLEESLLSPPASAGSGFGDVA